MRCQIASASKRPQALGAGADGVARLRVAAERQQPRTRLRARRRLPRDGLGDLRDHGAEPPRGGDRRQGALHRIVVRGRRRSRPSHGRRPARSSRAARDARPRVIMRPEASVPRAASVARHPRADPRDRRRVGASAGIAAMSGGSASAIGQQPQQRGRGQLARASPADAARASAYTRAHCSSTARSPVSDGSSAVAAAAASSTRPDAARPCTTARTAGRSASSARAVMPPAIARLAPRSASGAAPTRRTAPSSVSASSSASADATRAYSNGSRSGTDCVDVHAGETVTEQRPSVARRRRGDDVEAVRVARPALEGGEGQRRREVGGKRVGDPCRASAPRAPGPGRRSTAGPTVERAQRPAKQRCRDPRGRGGDRRERDRRRRAGRA